MRQAPRAAAGDRTGARYDTAAGLPGTGDSRARIVSSHHGHDLGHWPLHDTLILGALPDAVPSARAHLRRLLRQWGHAELVEDASIVISELVTNAVFASAELPPVVPVLMWLGSDRRRVLAGVADASPRPPLRLSPAPDAERGRGLTLVEAFTSRWGWHPASSGRLKKFTWAEWHLPIRAGQPATTGRPDRGPLNHRCHLAEEETMQESPGPDPGRSHDVSGLTDAELERARRELQASLALARPGSTASVPILAHLSAIDTELAGRSAGYGTSATPPGHRTRTAAGAFHTSIRPSEPGRPG